MANPSASRWNGSPGEDHYRVVFSSKTGKRPRDDRGLLSLSAGTSGRGVDPSTPARRRGCTAIALGGAHPLEPSRGGNTLRLDRRE